MPLVKSITINGVRVRFFERNNHYYCKSIDGDSVVTVAASTKAEPVLQAYERQVMALKESA